MNIQQNKNEDKLKLAFSQLAFSLKLAFSQLAFSLVSTKPETNSNISLPHHETSKSASSSHQFQSAILPNYKPHSERHHLHHP